MQTKTEQIKNAIIENDYIKAISIASKFFDRSVDTKLFKQAQSAINNPSFYKQLGKEPQEIISQAINILKSRFA